MRYRALDGNGDYTFGRGSGNFLINNPTCVGQLVLTRLRLLQGEWYINTASGTPWLQSVMGTHTKPIYDMVIRDVVLNTQGVRGIAEYESSLDPLTRLLTVTMKLDTQYGQTTVSTTIGAPA